MNEWTALEKIQHDMAVLLPMQLMEIPREHWADYLDWLSRLVDHAKSDPEGMAYSIG